jgi:hypothetical protein
MGELRGNIMQGDGDGRPNASSYTVFKELSDQVAAQKARLDALLKSDLPGVNKLLPVGQALSPANPLGAHQ